jgi:hypothetical protein
VQVSYDEGLAIHIGPESCAVGAGASVGLFAAHGPRAHELVAKITVELANCGRAGP